nr:carbohydrate-binding domain-containing protein [Lachnospiraceae bacterium]
GMPETGEMPTAEGMPEISESQTAEGMPGTAEASEAENSTEESEEEETYVHISGGNLTIINDSGRDADGIDSNGDLIISGGTIRVSLVNNGNNSALDYGSESGGVAEISGGTVVACGSYSMAEHFDSSSTQASILYTYSEGAEAGTTVELEDANGNILLSYEAPQSFSAVNLSCPELEVGGTYMVVIGDMVEEITLDEISASYGDAASSGFGGSMNFGGMQPGGDRGGRGMRGGSVSSNGEAFEGGMPGGGGPGMSGNGMPGGGGPGMSGNGMPGEAETSGEGEAEETSVPAAAGTALSEFGSDTWLYIFISVIVIVAGIGFAYIYKRRK